MSDYGSKASIRVLVCSESKLFRDGVGALLNNEAGLDVVGKISTLALRERVSHGFPLHVVVLDAHGAGSETARCLEGVRGADSRDVLRVVLVADDLDEGAPIQHVGGAILGVVLREGHLVELVAAIRAARWGNMFVSNSFIAPISRYMSLPKMTLPSVAGRQQKLTEREHETLVLLAEGLSNVDIATRLSISIRTVKFHVSNLLGKLQVGDRAQLVALAYRTGVVGVLPAQKTS